MKNVYMFMCALSLLALAGCCKGKKADKVKKDKVEVLDQQEADAYANPKMIKEFS